MKELIFRQIAQNKEIKGVLRVIGKIIYYKYNDSEYAKKVIDQLKQKGAKIEFSKNNDWIRVDIFSDLEIIKLGDKEINLTESSNEQIEEFIFNFYLNQYKKLGFMVEVI